MLLLFTNASKQQPRQDLLNVICLPIGGRISFDYRKCWIEDAIPGKKDEELKGQHAIILYYDPRARVTLGDGSQKGDFPCISVDDPTALDGVRSWETKEWTFIPIRYAKIVKVERHLWSVTFNLELTDWFRFSETVEKSDKQITEVNVKLREHVPLRPRPDKLLVSKPVARENQSVFVAYDEHTQICPFKEGKGEAEWVKVVTYLRTLPSLSDCAFTCIYDGESLSPVNPPDTRSDLKIGMPHINVDAGESMQFRLFTIPGAKAVSSPTIQLDSSVANIVGPISRQMGGGIETLFDVRFRRTTHSQDVFFRVVTPDLPAGVQGQSVLGQLGRAGGGCVGPRLDYRLTVKPPLAALAVAAVLFAVGSLLASLDITTCGKIADWWDQTVTVSPRVNLQGTYIFICAKLLALMLTVASAVIALRKGGGRFN